MTEAQFASKSIIPTTNSPGVQFPRSAIPQECNSQGQMCSYFAVACVISLGQFISSGMQLPMNGIERVEYCFHRLANVSKPSIYRMKPNQIFFNLVLILLLDRLEAK